MTVQCNAVAIYCKGNGEFKLFDSHAIDLLVLPHPQGACVLLEISDCTTLMLEVTVQKSHLN